jgi:hypothetical protein
MRWITNGLGIFRVGSGTPHYIYCITTHLSSSLGATALREPWPPVVFASTGLYPELSFSILQSPYYYYWGWRWPVHKGDDLTTFIVPKAEKSGALTYWIPKGRLRPVAGKRYLYIIRENEQSKIQFSLNRKLITTARCLLRSDWSTQWNRSPLFSRMSGNETAFTYFGRAAGGYVHLSVKSVFLLLTR